MHTLIQNAIDAVSFGSLYALFALGIALIFGIMNLINFAYGELIMIGGFTLVFLGHPGWPLLILATIGVTVVFALAMERVAFRPVRGADPITLLVTSFAISYLLQNLAQVIFGSVPRTTNLSTSLAQSFSIGGIYISKLDVITVVVTLLLLAGLGLFLGKTRSGVQMRAAAEDFRTARTLGVNANRVIATAFALSGVLAGTAAILLVAETGVVTPTIGAGPVLIAFIATILGGLGTLRGAVLGAFILGVITVALQAYLPLELRYYRDAFAYAAVIAMLLARPQGLIVAKSTISRV
jgi:branched-chain amino acid transport system permease protein